MFEDYAVIPLDLPLPQLDTEKLREFVQTWCERCKFSNNMIRMVLYHARKPIVDGRPVPFGSGTHTDLLPADTEFAWDPPFRSHFPALCEWFDAMPFARLEGATLVTQTDHVNEHMDIFGQNNSVTYYEAFRAIEPRLYRIVFCFPEDQACRENSFFVTTEYGGDRQYVRLPADTCAFAMSSSTCYHGAVHQRGHFKTTAALYGRLDTQAHFALLQRSLDRYGSSAIRLARPGPVMGPAAEFPYGGADAHH